MSKAEAPGNGRVWETILVLLLLGLAAVAWFATSRLTTADMQSGILTRNESMPSMIHDSMSSMGAGSSHSMPMLGLFLVTWVVMMVAMMFPAVVPVVVTFDRWVRRTGRSRLASVLFAGGYLLVWSTIGLVFYAVMFYLEPRLPSGEAAVRWGAALLVLAGIYQLTPLKAKCLKECRSPLAFVAQHANQLRRSRFDAAKVGIAHGMFCLGCCWALMLVLVLLGIMSLAWMAAVAAVIFVEKVLPLGSGVPAVVATILIVGGGLLLVFPQPLPSLG